MGKGILSNIVLVVQRIDTISESKILQIGGVKWKIIEIV